MYQMHYKLQIINVDTLDLFCRKPDDDSIQSKHVALNIFV